MRRRRHALQVSTFPFLAVLLCTMGSLILILLVIDRRAKVVARAKAEAERADRAAAARMANRKHQEEWERRRQALHGLLAREVEQVHEKVQTAKEKADAATQLTKAERERIEKLRRKLEAERSSLFMGESALKVQKAKVEQETKETGARQIDLARMAANLDVLERTLADLKAARQRQNQTYSLVPYRGKHGDNRRPIYLECSGNGLVFHPDRYALGFPLNLLDVRAEVQRRIQRLEMMRTNGNDEESPAYLLVLLRPSGINNYYRTLASLVGLKLDFGYEMVDEDWVLDFSEDEKSRSPQPWMTARSAAPPRSPPLQPPPGVPTQGPLIINGNSLGSGPRQASGDIRRSGGPIIVGGSGHGVPPGSSGGGNGGPWRSPPGTPRGVAAGNPGAGLGNPYANGASAGGVPGTGAIAGIPGGTGPATAGGTTTWGSGSLGTPRSGVGGVPGGRGTSPGSGMASGGGTGTGGPGATGPGGNSLYPPSPGQGGGNGPGSIYQPRAQATGRGGTGTSPGLGNGNGQGSGIGNGGKGSRVLASAGGGGASGYGSNGPMGNRSAGSGNGSSPGGASARNSSTSSTGQTVQGGNSRDAGTRLLTGGGSGTTSSGPSGGSSSSGGGSGTGGGPPGSGGTPGGGDSAASGGAGAAGMPGAGSTGQASAAGQGSPGSADNSSGGAPSSPSINLTNPQKAPSSNGAGDGSWAAGGSSSGGGSSEGVAGGIGIGSSLPGAAPTPAPPPSRPPRLLSNRDWPIVLDCRDDGVALPFGDRRISTDSLMRAYGQNSPLYQVVKQLIDRRQASVRPGELPFRPSIRFRVHPDGQRTYYFSYPALESLRLPMTRENVYPEPERR